MCRNLLLLALMALSGPGRAQPPPCEGITAKPLISTSARVLMLGEMHGTNEYISLAKALLCQLSKSADFLVLGLEMPHGEQVRLTTYLNSPGRPQDQQALTDSEFWNAEWQDGRRSQAMFSLIEHVRRMHQSGVHIAMDAFDVQAGDLPSPLTPDEKVPPETRDAFMAHHIELRTMQYPKATHLALTGSVHASKSKAAGAKWGAGDEPMALRLNGRLPVYAIGANLSGGMAWQCWERSGPGGCKAKAIDPADAGEGFDLRIDLGQLTASPPQKLRLAP